MARAKNETRLTKAIKAQILTKYDTLEEFATEVMGITPSNFAGKMQRLSDNFLKDLEKAGINTKSHPDTIQTISGNTGDGINSNINGGSTVNINNGELGWLKEKADLLNKIVQVSEAYNLLAEENKQLRGKLHECETRNQQKQGEKSK